MTPAMHVELEAIERDRQRAILMLAAIRAALRAIGALLERNDAR